MNVSLARRLTAEALGTAFLLATVVGSGIMAETLSPQNTGIALLGNTIATGAILYVLITMFGPVSGAHFNPAVTFAFLLRREIRIGDAGLYWLVQVLGGLAGVLLAHGMFEQELFQTSSTARTGGGQWLAETVATFGLVATIFMIVRFKPDAVAMGVGLYITAGYWFTASTSFANPAVTIARGFTDTFSGIVPGDVPGFVIAQFVGAALATSVCVWILRQSDASVP